MNSARVVATLALSLAVTGGLAGCGKQPTVPVKTSGEHVSAADQACRAQWRSVDDAIQTASAQGVLLVRAFTTQWESIRAGVSYYEITARASQCGQLLTSEKAKITALSAVIAKARPYDLEAQSAQATTDRDAWKAAHPQGKEPKPVQAGYRTLAGKLAVAERDIAPALNELAAADPGNAAVVTARLKDLALLADTSTAFQACKQALRTITLFHHPPPKKAKPPKKHKK